jgi:hypothetical protein
VFERPAARRILTVLAFTTAMCVAIGPARALDLGEWVPGLRLTPFLSERLEYESNVFQVPSHAKDDLIIKTIPGLLLEYGSGANWVSVGYRVEILNFVTLSNQDAVHHIFLGQLHQEFARLIVDVRDNFVKTTDPPGTELTGRIESTTNTLSPEVVYRLTERFRLSGNASWIHVHFPTIPQLDREEYLAGLSGYWKALPKTDLQLRYNYGVKAFDSDSIRDVTRHVIEAAVRGELTAKLSSTFRIGFEDREPTHDRPGLKGYRGVIAGGDWTYRPTERLTLTLLTDRAVQESIFANALYYVQSMATLIATQTLGPKITLNARVTGGVNEYPVKSPVDVRNPAGRNKFRNDTIIGWGGGVTYDVQRWLRAGLDFIHIDRDSNFPLFSFKDDKIAATVTLQF